MKLGISNEDATCRLGFHHTAVLNPRLCTDSPFCVYDDPKRLYAIPPKPLYVFNRFGCTASAVLRVRLPPKRLSVFAGFTQFHDAPGRFPWWSLDDAGGRLVRFAHRFGSYDSSNDPEQSEQERLLRTLNIGGPEDPVSGDYEFLWHCLFAVVRADRFNDGLIAEHALALTRIANELRRRLLLHRAAT